MIIAYFLAEFEPVHPQVLGEWLIVCLAVLSGIWLIRQLWTSFFPPQKGTEAYVTKAELQQVELSLTNKLSANETTMKTEIAAVRKDIGDRLREQRSEHSDLMKYMQDSMHRHADNLGIVVNQMAALTERSRIEMDQSKLIREKLDKQSESQARTMAILERSFSVISRREMQSLDQVEKN